MASILGREYGRLGNYVPHPLPKYAPDGYFRCASCNALVRNGEECECEARSANSDAQDVRVTTGQTYWDEFVEDGSRRRRRANARVRE